MEASAEILHAFRWLEQVQPSERLIVGDKAYYLSVLLQRGYPVLPGFVVTAPVLRQFLEQMNWLEPMFADLPNSSLHFNVDDSQQLQAIAHQIRQSIRTTPLPSDWVAQILTLVQSWDAPALILRPSLALHRRGDPSFSQRVRGLLMSQNCWVTERAIAQALQSVWGELFHARSLFYWQRSHIPLQHLHLAVLVQPLWPTETAGQMQVNETAVHVQAVCGFGQGLTWGEVSPDQYVLGLNPAAVPTAQPHPKLYTYRLRSPVQGDASASPLELVSTLHPLQPALQDDQLKLLRDLGQRAKADLGHGVDLEWCYTAPTPHSLNLWLTQVGLPSARATGALPGVTQLGKSVQIALQAQNLRQWSGLAASPGRVIKPVKVIDSGLESVDSVQDHILVVPAMNPEWLSVLRSAAGLITEYGGITSHGAILARELGLPAVVGVVGVMDSLQSGDVVLLDGDRGTLSLLPTQDMTTVAADCSPPRPKLQRSTVTQLMVTLSQPERLEAIAQLPVKGLGLLRAEHLLMHLLNGKPLAHGLAQPEQFVEALIQEISPFVKAFAPRSVFYRSADLRSHEYPSFQVPSPVSLPNPLLGWHGPLAYLQDPTLFQVELQALRRIQQLGHTNLRLLLPFIRTVEEVRACLTWVREAGLYQEPDFQVWIMAEVPAVLFQLPEFVQAGVTGIAIGTNDLTQLLLAIDRDHPPLFPAYTPAHPAVLRAMQHLIETAKSLGIPCMVCGEAPVCHPEMIPDLVRWGVTGLSVSPDAVELVSGAIAQAEYQLLLEAARESLH